MLPGTYTVTAGPLPPGYPNSNSQSNVVITAGQTTTVPNIPLQPVPYLAYGSASVNDCASGGGGNCNGYPEPGENNLLLTVGLHNVGATTATSVQGTLTSLTTGVTVQDATASYPDIPAGQTISNTTPFRFAIANTVPCGTVMNFRENVITAQGPFTATFSLVASVPQSPQVVFSDDMENGAGQWTHGGTRTTPTPI
jgi:hypothetical protein